ncbi:MAG TPA: PAS domain S-box protein [Burkholderiales bacterium]
MSLRLRINLLVTALMLLFVLVLGAIIVDATRRQISEEIAASTRVTVQLLTTVVYTSQFVPGAEGLAAQMETVHTFLRNLGRVRANEVRLYNGLGDLVYVSPPSAYKAGRHAPAWFAALVGPEPAQVVLPLRGGRLVIVPDASRSILDAWDDLGHLAGVALVFFAAVNLLVFWLIGRLLRPVREILRGLAAIREGRFDTRLPEFALPELSAISETFNSVADALERGTAENQRLALVVEQTSDAILIADRTGRIHFSNSAAARLFGSGDGTLAGKALRALAPPGKEQEVAAQLEAAFRGEAVQNVETQRRRYDGTLVDVSLSTAPLVEPRSGAVIGQILSLRDITEKKRAEEAARELRWNRRITHIIQERVEQERRALARELHDELSQYATAIRTIGMTIANRAGEAAPEIRSQALTVVSIGGQLYDMVRGMIRQLRASAPHRLGLARALEDAVGGWQARHRDVRFELKLPPRLETVPEELAAAVYRIVQEALNNALRHAGATRVEVELRWGGGPNAADAALEVAITDDGRGLAPDAAAGGGFGLLGMRERVEALHGQLRIDSRPGEGLRLLARLPLPAGAAADTLSTTV